MSFYQQSKEDIFMFPLDIATPDYFKPLNGTSVTANPVTYPWYDRISVIPDGLDWDIPKRIKEKVWGIGSGKHPNHIINTEFEPVEITLECMHQDARFLSFAVGSSVTADTKAGSIEQDLDITCIGAGSEGALATGDYFLIYTMDGDGVAICNEVYFDVGASDPGSNGITGATAIEVEVGANDTATQVAAALFTKLDLETNYSASTGGAGIASVTIHGPDDSGAVLDVRDGPTGSGTAFTFTYVTMGASTHTIIEQIDNTMQKFGLHIEYDNGSEDIAVDLFSCFVSAYELTIDYEEKIAKESVTIMCPFGITGLVSTIPPPRRTDNTPAIWAHLVESASNYVIMSGTTDITPVILNKMTLTIENEVELYPAIGSNYRQNIVSGKRTVTMNLVGFIQTNDLWETWATDIWNDAAGYYVTRGEKLNSVIKVEKTSTYDTWLLKVNNWLIEEDNMRLFSIDDKILGIDIKFTGATPTSGVIIDNFVVTDYIAKLFYGEENS